MVFRACCCQRMMNVASRSSHPPRSFVVSLAIFFPFEILLRKPRKGEKKREKGEKFRGFSRIFPSLVFLLTIFLSYPLFSPPLSLPLETTTTQMARSTTMFSDTELYYGSLGKRFS